MPALDEVRPQVEREFMLTGGGAQIDAMYARMLARYRVVIESGATPGTSGRVPTPGAADGATPRKGRRADAGRTLCWRPRGARRAMPADAHELRPGFLELRETGPGIYSFLWKKPAGGEVEIYIAPMIPTGCRLTPPGEQSLTPGRARRPRHAACAGGIAGQDAGDRRPRIDRHRRHRPRPSCRRPAGEPPAQADEPLGDARGPDVGVAAGGRVPPPRHRAHPARRRPPALRARPAADRRRPLDAGEDDHGLHGRPQHHAGDCHARLRQRAGAAAERRHRAEHPVPRDRDRPPVARRDELHDSPSVDRRVRVRPAPRLRLRQRSDDDGLAAGGDPSGAAAVQRRGRGRSVLLRRV